MLRKLVRVGALLSLLAVLALGGTVGVLYVLGPPTYDGYEPEAFGLQAEGNPAEGERIASMTCVRCHYDPQTDALAGRSLSGEFAALGTVHAPNLTGDDARGLGAWTDAELIMLLRSGVHPQRKELLPPYMPYLPNAADVDLAHLLAFLRGQHRWVEPDRKADPPSELSLRGVLSAWLKWKPGPDRASLVLRPEEAEPIALGGYLANDLLQCHGCHSASLQDVDWVSTGASEGFYEGGTALVDLAGNRIVTPGLTQREDGGLGGWSYEEFRRALVEGIGKDGEVLRWPMPRYDALREGELESLYAYFETLPAAELAPSRPEPYKVVPQIVDPGRHEFERLGCPSCHPPEVEGMLSLQGVMERFPKDASLAAYISDPAFVDPDAWMPAYGHLIDDAQMDALLEYIRRRVTEGPYAPAPKE